MAELRVPTVSHPAEVVDADGRRTAGQVFLPAQASSHSGETRPEEWINAPGDFFPFLPAGGAFVILNKSQVVMVAVGAPPDPEEAEQAQGVPRRQVSIECGALHLEGTLMLDVRESHRRVLDHLNRPERFLVLFDGTRRLLVRKDAITRLNEGPEA